MPGGYGSKKSGVKIGVFWDGISVSSDGSTAKITDPHVNIDRDQNITDTSNSLKVSGGSVTDDSWSNLNLSGSGEERIKTVSAQTVTLQYGTTSSFSFSASLSGIDYGGIGTLTASKSITFPARAYIKPDAPTLGVVGRTSATSASTVVKWTNNPSTPSKPYTAVFVERLAEPAVSTGSTPTWVQVSLNLSATATTWTDTSTAQNYRYKYRVVAKNTAGNSAPSAQSAYIYTAPLPAGNATVVKSGANLAVDWTNSFTFYTGTQITPNRAGVDAAPVNVVAPAATWLDTAVTGVLTYYTLKHYISGVPLTNGTTTTLYSTAVVTPTVNVLGPPNAPTVTLSDLVVEASSMAQLVTWVHKPVDATAQTAAEVRYRDLAVPAVYVTTAKTLQTTHSYPAGTFANGKTYGVQVRTKGSFASFGAWSDEITFITSGRPVATIASPVQDSTVYFASLNVDLTYFDPEGGPAQEWEIQLFDPRDSTTMVWPGPEDPATQPGSTHLTPFTIPYSMQDQHTYTLKARVQDLVGLWSAWVETSFAVDFAEPPKGFFIDGSCDYDTGAIVLEVYLPVPAAIETVAIAVTVERLLEDQDVWQPIVGFNPASPPETVEATSDHSFRVTDPIPPLGVPVTYRVLTASAIPTYVTGDDYTVDCSLAVEECRYPDGMAIYLNAGADWSVRAKIIGEPAVAEGVEREKVLVTPVGRTSPIELIGRAVAETYGLSGVVARDALIPTYMVNLGATRADWAEMAKQAAPICYRDPFGKRVFCSISGVSTDWGTTPVSQVSATLTRVSGGEQA